MGRSYSHDCYENRLSRPDSFDSWNSVCSCLNRNYLLSGTLSLGVHTVATKRRSEQSVPFDLEQLGDKMSKITEHHHIIRTKETRDSNPLERNKKVTSLMMILTRIPTWNKAPCVIHHSTAVRIYKARWSQGDALGRQPQCLISYQKPSYLMTECIPRYKDMLLWFQIPQVSSSEIYVRTQVLRWES